MSSHDCGSRAGFWRRLAAIWIDTILVYLACLIAFSLAVKLGFYFPFELTAVLLAVIYSIVAIAWKGWTAGKAVCGLSVLARDGRPAGVLRAVMRETVGKLLSCVLLLGFLWVAWTRSKRAWHDHAAGTIVRANTQTRSRRLAAASLATLGAAFLGYAGQLAWFWNVYSSIAPPKPYALRYENRDAAELTEVSALEPADRARLAAWIANNSLDPVEYAVEKARKHRLVIFGETHSRRPMLDLLNRSIPELYRHAGIRFVAMETLRAEDNDLIARLVTSPSFDKRAVFEVARNGLWGVWGYQEYWDVIETVWKVNRDRSAGQPVLRLVGLDLPFDAPTMALLGFEKNPGSHSEWWEKLRAVRLARQFPRALVRDAWLAREVDRQMRDPRARGIVWVGTAHSCIHCPRPGAGIGDPRMGFMLARKYGRDVFQIVMHGGFTPAAVQGNAAPAERMTEFIEGVMPDQGRRLAGFDVEGSPLAVLRDSGAMSFHPNKRLGFSDIAAGYIYLGKAASAPPCNWMKGYVSDEMFARNKPFYVSFGIHYKRPVARASDADDILASVQ